MKQTIKPIINNAIITKLQRTHHQNPIPKINDPSKQVQHHQFSKHTVINITIPSPPIEIAPKLILTAALERSTTLVLSTEYRFAQYVHFDTVIHAY